MNTGRPFGGKLLDGIGAVLLQQVDGILLLRDRRIVDGGLAPNYSV